MNAIKERFPGSHIKEADAGAALLHPVLHDPAPATSIPEDAQDILMHPATRSLRM
jgi:hypothetical protein